MVCNLLYCNHQSPYNVICTVILFFDSPKKEDRLI